MTRNSLAARSLAGFAAFCAAALCAFAPAPASAQARDSVYTVAGVRVDASAQNATEAQNQAFAAGRRLAFERLVRRVTLPDDIARVGMPRPDDATLDRLVASIDVNDERRSGTRYLGRLSLRFQAGPVQQLLRGAGLTVVDQRGPPILIVPLVTAVTQEAADAWRLAWEQGGYETELVPLLAAPRSLVGSPSWAAAAPHAQAAGAQRAIYLDMRMADDVATATMIEVGADGSRRDRGSVRARVGSDAASLQAAMQALADQANERIQNEWKVRLATTSGQRARVSASALYSNMAEWQRIKAGLEAAASTMISEIRIEAVARQGALVSFSYVGDRAQLASELRRHGVLVEETQQGPVLRAVR